VEYQNGQIVKDAEERIKAHSSYDSIRQSDNWRSLLNACLSDSMTGVLLDPVTWWCKAVVPPKNRYFIKTEDGSGSGVIMYVTK